MYPGRQVLRRKGGRCESEWAGFPEKQILHPGQARESAPPLPLPAPPVFAQVWEAGLAGLKEA